MDKALIVYFSGTGGTERIAVAFRKDLSSRGFEAETYNLDRSSKKYVDPASFSGNPAWVFLLFPVYAFDAPELIYDWIERTPITGAKAVVVSVSGGGETWPNTGCRARCCRTLEQNRFEVVGDTMMCMPSNWVITLDDHAAMRLLAAVPSKAAQVVDAAFAGTLPSSASRRAAFNARISGWEKIYARTFACHIAVGDCVGCGWCSRNCPVDNITLRDAKPVYGKACIMCFRCIYECPSRALSSKNFMVLDAGYDLDALEKRMAGVELKPVEECCKGTALKAIRRYLLEDSGEGIAGAR